MIRTIELGHVHRDGDGLIQYYDVTGKQQRLTLGKLREMYQIKCVTLYAEAFDAAKFYTVEVVDMANFQPSRAFVWAWANENIGEDHFTWTGNAYWFDHPENAMMFKLRWG